MYHALWLHAKKLSIIVVKLSRRDVIPEVTGDRIDYGGGYAWPKLIMFYRFRGPSTNQNEVRRIVCAMQVDAYNIIVYSITCALGMVVTLPFQ